MKRDAQRLERLVVLLVAAHSYAVGVVLLFATGWALDFGGWAGQSDPFFPRQGGAFHLVLATGYLLEYFRHGSVTLLISAKFLAAVFLLVSAVASDVPWAVPFSGVMDGLMGVVVLGIRRASRRREDRAAPQASI